MWSWQLYCTIRPPASARDGAGESSHYTSTSSLHLDTFLSSLQSLDATTSNGIFLAPAGQRLRPTNRRVGEF